MKKILVPMDFSPMSEKALKHALDCACDSIKEILLMGSEGRGVVAEILLGSVAERVLRHAPAPVSVVKPRDVCMRVR